MKPRLSRYVAASLSAMAVHSHAHDLKLATFNIRYSPGLRNAVNVVTQAILGRPDASSSWGERPWSERGPRLVDQVLWELPDVIGFQEALWHQLEDLSNLLSHEYDWVGVGRDDGQKKGEAVPIFWRKDKMQLIKHEHFWLSETPSIPGSKSWDMGQTRMVTLARFQLKDPRLALVRDPLDPQPPPKFLDPDLGPELVFDATSSTAATASSPDEVWILNTHWDDRGIRSRTEAAKVILRKIESLVQSHDRPLVILMGDLNSPASQDGYRTLTGHRYVAGQQTPKTTDAAITFFDTRHALVTGTGQGRLSAPYGQRQTFTGFQPTDKSDIIDYILVADVSPAGEPIVEVTRYGVLSNVFEQAFLVSDHRMVSATLHW